MKKLYKFINERRIQKRIPLENILPSFRLNNTLISEEIIVLNVSKSGLCLKSKYIIQENTIIELFLQIPDSISIPITSRIVWKGFLDDANLYGSEIIALPEHFKFLLFDYLDK
jgi:hypothetical protein